MDGRHTLEPGRDRDVGLSTDSSTASGRGVVAAPRAGVQYVHER